MYWDQIAKVWTQFVARAVPLRRITPEVDVGPDNFNRAARSFVDVHEEARTQPYTPDNRKRYNESSLHLSC